jgi:parallel beta-helix repeat protein
MGFKSYRFILPIALSLLLVGNARATIRRVPTEFPTIQAAIGAAASTDTVLVAPGTYSGPGNWDISFAGKDIVLQSEAGPAITIIDALSGTAGNHRVFSLAFSGPTASRIDGFTITGGRHCSSSAEGAGILCGGGAPTITNCVIRSNWVGCSDPNKTGALSCGSGGGLYIWGASTPVRIVDCIFEENGGYCVAGAIALNNSQDVTFERCSIVRNRELGVLVRGTSRCVFVNCTVAGTPALDDGFGLGIDVWPGASVVLERTIVWGNCTGIRALNEGSIQATCSVIDTSLMSGTGEIEFSDWNAFVDPLFCAPNVCPQWPFSEPGDYRVQSQSVALPENNPCGVLIGALGSCEAQTDVPGGLDRIRDPIGASPNPFVSSTIFSFATPQAHDATITVFDVTGRRIRTLPMPRAAVQVNWDGTDDSGRSVPSGTYLLQHGTGGSAGRVTIVR